MRTSVSKRNHSDGTTRTSNRSDPHELGRRGEQRVCAWYLRNGYTLLERNWRIAAGEIDIIAVRGDCAVFCEVKTRSSNRFGTPAEAVTPAKQLRIRRLAAAWLQSVPSSFDRVRFDVAAVQGTSIDVIEGAF